MNDVYKLFEVRIFICRDDLEYKIYLILECLRILKPNGGQLLIYTWALEQKQRKVND